MSIFNRKQTAEIDYDKLADAIVKAQQKADTKAIKNAIVEAQEELKTKDLEEQNQKIEKWQKTIGYDKNSPEWKNDLRVFCKLLVIKKQEAVADVANNVLLKIAISFLYLLLEYLIYAFCIIFLIVSISKPYLFAFSIPFDVISILIARTLRIARFEADNINDKNYLISIISTSVSVFALVVAIVTIFVNK